MIKLLHLPTCFRYYDIFTKPLRRMTTLSRFPAKMTLVHARALLGSEKISFLSSSWNLNVSNRLPLEQRSPLFVCLLESVMVLACVRGRYRKGKGNGERHLCVFARSILVPSRSWHAGYDGPKGAAQWKGRTVTERGRFSDRRYIKEMLFFFKISRGDAPNGWLIVLQVP